VWVPFKFSEEASISWKCVREDGARESWEDFDGTPELRGKDLEPGLVDSTCTSKVGMGEKRSDKVEDLRKFERVLLMDANELARCHGMQLSMYVGIVD